MFTVLFAICRSLFFLATLPTNCTFVHLFHLRAWTIAKVGPPVGLVSLDTYYCQKPFGLLKVGNFPQNSIRRPACLANQTKTKPPSPFATILFGTPRYPLQTTKRRERNRSEPNTCFPSPALPNNSPNECGAADDHSIHFYPAAIPGTRPRAKLRLPRLSLSGTRAAAVPVRSSTRIPTHRVHFTSAHPSLSSLNIHATIASREAQRPR